MFFAESLTTYFGTFRQEFFFGLTLESYKVRIIGFRRSPEFRAAYPEMPFHTRVGLQRRWARRGELFDRILPEPEPETETPVTEA
jgi:hypothetical protein